jgi:hypothetical protein
MSGGTIQELEEMAAKLLEAARGIPLVTSAMSPFRR